MNIYFAFAANTGGQTGKLFVDDYSSLYGLSQGEQFTIQYDPGSPSKYYCAEASSLSQTIPRTIIAVVVAGVVIMVLMTEFFGR
jgi:hypothetical protein